MKIESGFYYFKFVSETTKDGFFLNNLVHMMKKNNLFVRVTKDRRGVIKDVTLEVGAVI